MKVLHITTSVVPQSASYRLHKAEQKYGIDSYVYILSGEKLDSHVLVNTKINGIKGYIDFFRKRAGRFFERAFMRITSKKIHTPISLAQSSLIDRKIIDDINPDIINLHWICGGFISIKDMEWLSKYRVVWTMHDSWAFTGGCHIPYDCKKYMEQCVDCPQIKSKCGIDIAKKIFMDKLKVYHNARIHVVTPSKWLADCVRSARLFQNKSVNVIHNTINTSKFFPVEKAFARQLLSIKNDVKIVLFGAMNSTSDINKGFEYLYKAIQTLYYQRPEENINLIVFGSNEPKARLDFGFPVTYLGLLRDELSLMIAYSAADVMVVPSKSENFPNTILEAMACGTPCVAFKIGGIPEQIDHGLNGYLAKPYDSGDLATGIMYVLDDVKRKELSVNARNKVLNSYDEKIIAKQYSTLYEQIIYERR